MKNIATPTISNEADSIEQLTGPINQFFGGVLTTEDSNSISSRILGSEIYKHFISLLVNEVGKSEKAGMQMHSLHGGFFCHEAAKYCNEIEEKKKLLLMALRHYELFQGEQISADINYYVQWQLSLVKEQLGYEWTEVEKSLLNASKFHKDRGEAIRHVVQHYRGTQEYGFAYIYSSIAKQNYYGKYAPSMKWFADPAYYQWKVLNYHASICSHLGNGPEAEATFQELWSCGEQHPEYFTEEQFQGLFRNQKAFQS